MEGSSKGPMILYVTPSGLQVVGRDIRLVSLGHMPVPEPRDPRKQESGLWGFPSPPHKCLTMVDVQACQERPSRC